MANFNKVLTEEEIKEKLTEAPGWAYKGDRIEKRYEFKDFKESMEFVQKIGEMCAYVGHNPIIGINNNKVVLSLTTKEDGGVTSSDIMVAQRIDML
ncbi:4a-hydroxytetrahydrobiopterin dehydratase [Candidatus Woesearchaeota archaeon]|nr:4a-hydroxytetrahydrobiopterin dehydratase [Candidatus Woesearchaeota archaeon]